MPSKIKGTRARRAEHGFTLLEILVAFTILAISIGALLQAFGTGLRGTRSSEAHAVAGLQARSLLDAVAGTIPLEPGQSSGTFDNGFRWTADIRRYPRDQYENKPRPTVIPYEVEIGVFWDDDRSVRLKTLRLVPRRRR